MQRYPADKSAGRLLERSTVYFRAKNGFLKSSIILAVVLVGSLVAFKLLKDASVSNVIKPASPVFEGVFYFGRTVMILIRSGLVPPAGTSLQNPIY